jgi:hypothetical protein
MVERNAAVVVVIVANVVADKLVETTGNGLIMFVFG